MSSLRSRGSFVLINVKSGQILLWNGSKSGINTRQRALEIAQNLKSSCPLEMGIAPAAKLVMTKMDEGCEVHTFFDAMGLPDTTAYVSLMDGEYIENGNNCHLMKMGDHYTRNIGTFLSKSIIFRNDNNYTMC